MCVCATGVREDATVLAHTHIQRGHGKRAKRLSGFQDNEPLPQQSLEAPASDACAVDTVIPIPLKFLLPGPTGPSPNFPQIKKIRLFQRLNLIIVVEN